MAKLNGIDCVTEIHQELAEGLKAAGVKYVGRYLGNNWKSISKKEADVLIKAGLKIISIWEINPTNARYFTKDKGIADGKDASSYAKLIGQAEGSAIYFAVDYDAQPSEMKAILNYFFGVRLGLGKNYKIGVYGSYTVLEMLHSADSADCYWQTAAWSSGNVADFIDILQYGFNKKIAGIPVDYNQFSNSAGSWGKDMQAPSIGGSFQSSPSPPSTNTYTVHPGDTLSKIAVEFGTTVNQLRAWNRISNPDLIMAGQRIRVK